MSRTTCCGPVWRHLVLVSLWIFGACVVWAAGFGQPYKWREQGRVHEVWVDPTLVAEIAPAAGAASGVPQAIPGLIRVTSPWRGVRLWRLPGGQNALQALATLNAAASAGAKFLPVFRDAPDWKAPMRLLGQELIVKLPSNWDRAQVRQWANRQSLTLVRKMPVGAQTYLLRAAVSDVQLLALVNKLEAADTVQSVYPNWRRAVTIR